MNLFKKNTAAENEVKPRKFTLNKTAFKYGTFSAGLIAIMVAAVIILNVIMSVMVDRGLLKIDLSSGGQYTMSEENIAFLEGIDKPITITVLSDEASYSGGTMNEFSQKYKNVVDDANYYAQTVNLIKRYSEINKNITVKFENFYGSRTNAISEEYTTLFYGDIYIEITDAAGKTRNRLVTFDDIYTYSDPTGYAAYGYPYYIDSNNLETAVTSAINTLVSGNTTKMALISAHSTESIFTTLYAPALKLNGFEMVELEGVSLSSIPEEVETLVIAAPESDFLPEELDVLNKWLDNDGKRGHSLLVFPGNSMGKLSNFKEFLAEWGVSYGDGTLYETNKNYIYGDNSNMHVFTNQGDSEMFKAIKPDKGDSSLVGSSLPITVTFEEYSSRATNVLVSTNDSVTVKPASAGEDWKPAENAELKSYPNLVITADTKIIDEKPVSSYVAAFSSYEFIYSAWAQYSSLQNLDVAVNTATFVSGMDADNKLTFVPKTIEDQSFADSISETDITVITVIFMFVLPIAIVVAGIVVWVRRRRK